MAENRVNGEKIVVLQGNFIQVWDFLKISMKIKKNNCVWSRAFSMVGLGY